MNSLLLIIFKVLGILILGYKIFKIQQTVLLLGAHMLLLAMLFLSIPSAQASENQLALQLCLPGMLMLLTLKLQHSLSKKPINIYFYIGIGLNMLFMLYLSYVPSSAFPALLLHFNTIFLILSIILYIYLSEINGIFRGKSEEKYLIIQIVYCYFCYILFKSILLLALLHYPQMVETQLNWLMQFPLFVIIILLGQELWRNFQQTHPIENKVSTIDQDFIQFAQQIECRFKDEKIYLESDLSLTQFCQQFNIPQAKMSKVLHHYFKKNFYQLLAEYRIQHAVEIIKAKKHIKIQSIAYDSGFNSTPVFNRHFKNIIGLQPSQYLKTLQHMQES